MFKNTSVKSNKSNTSFNGTNSTPGKGAATNEVETSSNHQSHSHTYNDPIDIMEPIEEVVGESGGTLLEHQNSISEKKDSSSKLDYLNASEEKNNNKQVVEEQDVEVDQAHQNGKKEEKNKEDAQVYKNNLDDDNDDNNTTPKTVPSCSSDLSSKGYEEDPEQPREHDLHMKQQEQHVDHEDDVDDSEASSVPWGDMRRSERQIAAAYGDFDDDEESYTVPVDTTLSLINQGCCGSNCGPGAYDKPWSYRVTNGLKWVAWFMILFASLFFVVLCIGAQAQETTVRSLLPVVDKAIYEHMNEGPVCAYDDRQPYERGDSVTINGTITNLTRSEKVELTQRDFETPEEAHAAGYEILHCGRCGKCSNWHDLRLEYATREMLGSVALECAKKVLFGGTFEDLVACTMEKTGFQEPCARCWAWDYQCVRQNCLFISLRAFIINSVTNLQVGAHDITPSTCEEAMCEAPEITYPHEGFVLCSGATRRRMNVTSTITRPGNQQCAIVDVLPWDNFFGPSTGNKDYDPKWGDTYEPA